jgi:hypothetical protein
MSPSRPKSFHLASFVSVSRRARAAGGSRGGGALLVAVLAGTLSGCLSWSEPAAYGGRERLGVEKIAATNGEMIAYAPKSLESSAGRIAIETLDVDPQSIVSPRYSRAVRVRVAGPSQADAICVHEPEGEPYRPPFELAKGGAFACLGVIDAARFTLVMERSCYEGVMTFGENERYTLTRGKITLAGIDAPSDQVSVHDAHGNLVAAFDLVPSMSFRVWSGAPNAPDPSRARLIVAAAALHDWSAYASAAKLGACK